MYEEAKLIKGNKVAMSGIGHWIKLSKGQYALRKKKKDLEFKINIKRTEYR